MGVTKIGKRLSEKEVLLYKNKLMKCVFASDSLQNKQKIKQYMQVSKNMWLPLDISKIKINKPTVLCLPGSGADSSKHANGLAKFVCNLIGADESVDVFAINYFNKNGNVCYASKEEVKEIVFHIFMPLCIDNSGNRLPKDVACKNVRFINVISHCYGAEVLEMIDAELKNQLSDVGYDAQEIQEIQRSIFHIGYSPKQEQMLTNTNLFIKPIYDEFLGEKFKKQQKISGAQKHLLQFGVGKYYENMQNQSKSFLQKIKLAPQKCNNQTMQLDEFSLDLFCGNLNCFTDGRDHNISSLKRTNSWQIETSQTQKADVASKTVAYAMAIAVNNSAINVNSKYFVPLQAQTIKEPCQNILNELVK